MFKTKKFKEIELENKILKNKIENASFSPDRFINKIKDLIESNDFSSVKHLIKTLTDYLTLKEATHCLLRNNTHSTDKNDMLLWTIYGLYRNFDVKTIDCDLKFSINELNLILNTWNEDRIVSNIKGINSTNILYPCNNIRNYYIYPLDIVICGGGNHSQFSAKLRLEGESHISQIIDLSNLYSGLEFDGVNFVDINNKNEIVKSCDNEGEIIIGTLFEIGRLLVKHKVYFDNQIKKATKND